MAEPQLVVRNLAGVVLVELQSIPTTLEELRHALEIATGIPAALQKLVKEGEVLLDDTQLSDVSELICVKDETPMWTWDLQNPEARQIEVEGNVVKAPRLRSDFVNVLTKEPIRSGVHYFEFVLHMVGDEQWCGVTMSPEMAGNRVDGRSLKAWTYYCGRAGKRHGGTIHNGKGALHANRKAILEFEKACTPQNVINMLVDGDQRIVAFALDGRIQGACRIPGDLPLYVLTQMDTPKDHVELRKPMLDDAPQDVLAALQGSLIDLAQGEKLHGYRNVWDRNDRWACDSDGASD
eukprot:symbB.v1.2.029320.t1/scaffold3085.1/size64040/3